MTWLASSVIALMLALSSPSAFGQTATTTATSTPPRRVDSPPVWTCDRETIPDRYAACVEVFYRGTNAFYAYRKFRGQRYYTGPLVYNALEREGDCGKELVLLGWRRWYTSSDGPNWLNANWHAREDIIICHEQRPSYDIGMGMTCQELGIPHIGAVIEDDTAPASRVCGEGYIEPKPAPPPIVCPAQRPCPPAQPCPDTSPNRFTAEPVGNLEVPSDGSFQSGIGYVSGWVCDGRSVSIVIDGGLHLPPVARNIARGDTEAACGDRDNGFILHWNWNLLGEGTYTAALVIDGQTIQSNTFTITTLGEEFVRGVERDVEVQDFPSAEEDTRLRWQEPVQGFVLVPGSTD